MPKRTTKKLAKLPSEEKLSVVLTAADFHELARQARRSGFPESADRMLELARHAEREARAT